MHRPKCIGPLGFETLPIHHKNNNSTIKGQEISEEFFLVFNCSEKQKKINFCPSLKKVVESAK